MLVHSPHIKQPPKRTDVLHDPLNEGGGGGGGGGGLGGL